MDHCFRHGGAYGEGYKGKNTGGCSGTVFPKWLCGNEYPRTDRIPDCVTSYDLKKMDEMLAYYSAKGCEVKTLEEYKDFGHGNSEALI